MTPILPDLVRALDRDARERLRRPSVRVRLDGRTRPVRRVAPRGGDR